MPKYTAEQHEAQFWKRVNKTDTCWLWTGAITDAGYGRYTNQRWNTNLPHRIAWILLRGPLTREVTLDHVYERCRNTHCVNPDHLEPVSMAENQRRRLANTTHCKRGHELTADNTYNGDRRCRTCRNDRERARRHAIKPPRPLVQHPPPPPTVTHGRTSTYITYKCRCDLCRAAYSAYYRDYYRRKKRAA